MLAQLVRFAGVGGVATLIHVAVALAAREGFGVQELSANLAGFVAAVAFSYAGHARVTFDVALRPALQLPQFVFVSALGLATSSTIVWLVTERLGGSFVMSMAFVALAVPAVTFVALRAWVFSERHNAQRDLLGPGLALAGGIGTLALFWDRVVNHDTAWYLVATRKWLDGATLYRDIVEVNPPLNFYLTAPAVGLADFLGISDTNGQYVLMAAAITLALAVSWRTLRSALAMNGGRAAAVLAALWVAMVVPGLADAGQRDHLMVILALAWMLGEMARAPARRQVPLALLAAVGFCLKPYFVVFPDAVTLWRIGSERSLRPVISPSNLAFACAGLGYGAFVAIVHPLYLGEIVPLASLVYGGGYGTSLPALVLNGREALAIAAICGLVAVASRDGRSGLFACAAVAAAVSYLWQAKGFGYHLVPLLSFAFVQGALVAAGPGSAAIRLAALAVMTMIAAGGAARGFYNDALSRTVADEAGRTGPVASMMALTTQIDPGPAAAANLGAAWTSRYPANWLVPGAMEGLAATDCTAEPDICARLNLALATTRRHNLEDIAAARPDVIIFDRQPYFIAGGFDWPAFLRADPRAGAVLGDYAPVLSTARFDYWRRRN